MKKRMSRGLPDLACLCLTLCLALVSCAPTIGPEKPEPVPVSVKLRPASVWPIGQTLFRKVFRNLTLTATAESLEFRDDLSVVFNFVWAVTGQVLAPDDHVAISFSNDAAGGMTLKDDAGKYHAVTDSAGILRTGGELQPGRSEKGYVVFEPITPAVRSLAFADSMFGIKLSVLVDKEGGIAIDAPAIYPDDGNVALGYPIAISDAIPGASIACTTDGTDPEVAGGVIRHGTLFSSEIYLPLGISTVKAIAFAPSWNNSAMVARTFRISMPLKSIAGGRDLPPNFGDGIPATAATISPCSIAVDSVGNLYLNSGLLRKVDRATGTIRTLARLTSSGRMEIDAGDRLIVADNDRILEVSGDGVVTVLAGGGSAWEEGALGTETELHGVVDVAVDRNGDIYCAMSGNGFGNNRIRKLDRETGQMTTFAGSGEVGFSGDGGPAMEARFNWPSGLVFDPSGNLLVADANNNRLRRIDRAPGIITTIAGDGTDGFLGDTYRTMPSGMAFGADGNLYMADRLNGMIWMMDYATGGISEALGAYDPGHPGIGRPSANTRLQAPYDVAFDRSGNIFVAHYAEVVEVERWIERYTWR